MSQDDKKNPFIVRFLLVLVLFPISILISQLYYAYQTIFYAHWFENVIVKDIEEMKWNLIISIMEENREKACMQAENVKQKIVSDVAYHYYEKQDELPKDLESKDEDTLLSRILKESINTKYLNASGLNNRVFIASDTHILADNDRISSGQRTWEEEIASNRFPNLALNAVDMILTADSHIVYWGAASLRRKNSAIESYSVEDGVARPVEPLSNDHLKEQYEEEGLTALKKYDILVPVYIENLDEVFHKKEITDENYNHSPSKTIIVIQEFNLYDAVYSHKDRLDRYDYILGLSKQAIHNNIDTNLVALMLVIVLTLTSSIGMIYGARLLIKKHDGGDR